MDSQHLDLNIVENEKLWIRLESQHLDVNITESEKLNVSVVETENIQLTLTTVDMIKDKTWVIQTIKDCFVYNEVPTRITSKKFRADNSFVANSLQVFLNGIKEKYITVNSSTDFSFSFDTVTLDILEISYIKQ